MKRSWFGLGLAGLKILNGSTVGLSQPSAGAGLLIKSSSSGTSRDLVAIVSCAPICDLATSCLRVLAHYDARLGQKKLFIGACSWKSPWSFAQAGVWGRSVTCRYGCRPGRDELPPSGCCPSPDITTGRRGVSGLAGYTVGLEVVQAICLIRQKERLQMDAETCKRTTSKCPERERKSKRVSYAARKTDRRSSFSRSSSRRAGTGPGVASSGKTSGNGASGVRQLESLDFLNPWLAHLGGSAQKTGDWPHLFSA